MHLIELLRLLIVLGGTRAEALDISKVFNKVGHVAFLHKLKSYIVSGQILGLILSFISNRLFYVVLHGKSVQEYPVINGWVPQGSILDPTVFLIYINGLPDVTCNFAIVLLSTLNSIRHLI